MSTHPRSSLPRDPGKEMCTAAHIGDWKTVNRIIRDWKTANRIIRDWSLNSCLVAVLMMAVFRGDWKFFMEMLRHVEDPQILTGIGVGNKRNILHFVAVSGNIKSAKALVDKWPSLTQIADSEGLSPLHYVVFRVNDKDLVWYLTLVTSDEDPGRPISSPHTVRLIFSMMAAGYYDIVHFLLQRHQSLAEIIISGKFPRDKPLLYQLASKPSEFPSGAELGWLGCCVYPFIPVQVDDFNPPTHVRQLVPDFCTSSSNHCYPRMQISMQSIASAFQLHIFRSLLWSLVEKLVPGAQTIRDTKLKHELVIKLIKNVFQQPNWNSEEWSSHLPDFLVILKAAATFGIIEILEIFFENYIYILNGEDLVYLAIATIKHRQEKVFDFLLRHCMGFRLVIVTPKEETVDIESVKSYKEGTNMLHMTAKLTDCPKITSIAGAAFQMQRELQWFKEMETLVNPADKEFRNTNDDTAWEYFKKEHEEMRKGGEKWMKGTSNSCMLVATLIATVVFAAAFTVPGGNNQNDGTPILLERNKFMLFAAFDALALFLSINSLWMFLSILTARFAFEDFLKTLPKRLIIGFTTLFLAIVSTIIAFSAALSLMLGHRQGEVIVLVILLALVSVATFGLLQLPLFVDMVRSTYGPSLLGSR